MESDEKIFDLFLAISYAAEEKFDKM